jgi:hypothetical protein
MRLKLPRFRTHWRIWLVAMSAFLLLDFVMSMGTNGTWDFSQPIPILEDKTSVLWPLSLLLLFATAIVMGASRVSRTHPFENPEFYGSLRHMPWEKGKPLLLGPCTLRLYDFFTVSCVAFVAWRIGHHYWLLVFLSYFWAYEIVQARICWKVGSKALVTAFAFLFVSQIMVAFSIPALIAFNAGLLYLGYRMLWSTFETFPWESMDDPNYVESIYAVGYPYIVLFRITNAYSPKTTGRKFAESAFAGWLIFSIYTYWVIWFRNNTGGSIFDDQDALEFMHNSAWIVFCAVAVLATGQLLHFVPGHSAPCHLRCRPFSRNEIGDDPTIFYSRFNIFFRSGPDVYRP